METVIKQQILDFIKDLDICSSYDMRCRKDEGRKTLELTVGGKTLVLTTTLEEVKAKEEKPITEEKIECKTPVKISSAHRSIIGGWIRYKKGYIPSPYMLCTDKFDEGLKKELEKEVTKHKKELKFAARCLDKHGKIRKIISIEVFTTFNYSYLARWAYKKLVEDKQTWEKISAFFGSIKPGTKIWDEMCGIDVWNDKSMEIFEREYNDFAANN